jgi:hypothetical protein
MAALGELGAAELATEGTIFVSPLGKDTWTGRLEQPAPDGRDGPVASLAQAVALSRRVEAGRPRRIVLAAGTYWLDEPIDLGPDDSGLSIEAAKDGKAIVYGGRRVTGWHRDGETFWAAALPRSGQRPWDFRMVVVDGRMGSRARLPKEGTFTHQSEFNVPWMSTTGGGWKRKPTDEELRTMTYRPDDLGPWLDVANAEVTVYHMWDESVVGVAQHDLARHTLRFSTPCGHPPGAFGVKKYVVWNVREGMKEPGQWYLDRSAGNLVYWPLPGQDMTRVEVLAPTVESIVRIHGQAGRPVRDVTVRGLVLSVTNTPLVAGGFGAGKFAGAIEVAHAEHCTLAGLEIANVAGQGVRALNVKGFSIEGCHVHDTGACGLKFSGECLVRNNRVHHVGRIYPSAIAVWGDGRGGRACRIEHNTVHDTPYTAIACGGEDHRIESNRISRAMQVLHDGAGIYITFCKRIVLRGNSIDDIVDTGGYGASAYYLDEQAEDCLVEGNLSVRVARPSHNHMARNNTLRGNVFVCDGDATLTFPRSSGYRVEKNILVAKGSIRITRPEAITQAKDNVVFSGVGKVEGVRLEDYRQAGTATLSAGAGWLLVDPQLATYESGRVEFAPSGPAARIGLPTLDVRDAGCRP